jgi:hypothetical protein
MVDDGGGPARSAIERAITDMAEQIARRPFSRDLLHRLEWLVEILIERGHLEPSHRALINRRRADGSPVRLATYREKREVASFDPGCAERMHVCHARCCAMEIHLSAEDLDEGKLRWEYNQPYLLPKGHHGNCEHVQADGRCGVYDDRLGQCRAYDCVDDARIWIDYEQMIAQPMPFWLIPLGDRDLPPDEQQRHAAARIPPASPPAEAAAAAEAEAAAAAGADERG